MPIDFLIGHAEYVIWSREFLKDHWYPGPLGGKSVLFDNLHCVCWWLSNATCWHVCRPNAVRLQVPCIYMYIYLYILNFRYVSEEHIFQSHIKKCSEWVETCRNAIKYVWRGDIHCIYVTLASFSIWTPEEMYLYNGPFSASRTGPSGHNQTPQKRLSV